MTTGIIHSSVTLLIFKLQQISIEEANLSVVALFECLGVTWDKARAAMSLLNKL